MTLEQWDDLDGTEQSRYIAVYRASNQISAINITKQNNAGKTDPRGGGI